MVLYFFLLNLSLPVCLRIFCSKSVPFYARWIGFIEDLFVVLELFLLMSLSVPLAAILGCLIHFFLIVDSFLFYKMRLRINLSYFSHLHHVKSLYPSAKELGFNRLLPAGLIVLSGHLVGYLFFYRHLDVSLFSLILTLAVGVIAALGSRLLPKNIAYSANNILFEAQTNLFSKRKKAIDPLLENYPLWRWTSGSPAAEPFEVKIDPAEKPHLMLIFLESFAASAISKKSTPNFDRLAQEGILFSNFYSNGTLTYRALIAGLFGVAPGNTTEGLLPYIGVPFTGLPELLKDAGYKTAFFHNGSLSYDKQWEFLQEHFDVIADRNEIGGSAPSNSWGTHDEVLMGYTVDWLQQQQGPAFTTLFTITNHHPWIVPDHYQPPVFDLPINAPLQRFLQTVHYTDYSLGLLVDLLKKQGLSRKTILVIAGDHGQPMGQHAGNFYNSRFLYEENVRVPLLILAEGRILEPKVIEEIGSHVDLLPTLMDLLHLEGYHHSCGSSLIGRHKDRMAMLQNPYSEGFFGCRKGDWKWIENRLTSEGELYQLNADPEEKNNIAERHPHIAESMRLETQKYFAQLDQLYQQDKIAPPKAEKNVSRSAFELDLSGTMITDRELADLDAKLERLYLRDCLLVTDEGIAFVLSRCLYLEELNLQGMTDLTDQAFAVPHHQLKSLDISDAKEMTDRGVEALTALCPNLSVLSLNGDKLTDRGIEAISRSCKHLVRFKLLQAHQITDKAVMAVIQNNPHLGRLVLQGCTNLTDEMLRALKQHPLELLWLADAPGITDEGVACLAQLPLRSLRFEGCPQLTEKSIHHLQKLKLESLYFKNCQGLSEEKCQLFNNAGRNFLRQSGQ
jgi:arylsulfatase A-like enzyme